jgi:large subunit ribosomal protein L1
MAEAKKSPKPKAESSKMKKQKKEIKKAEVMSDMAPVEAAPKAKIEVEKDAARAGDSPTKPLAKSGKRSSRAIKETQEKAVKEARKAAETPAEAKSTAKQMPRSRLERAGKKYKAVTKLIEKDKVYSLTEALDLVTKTATTKFDSTVELHINLGVDPKQADQNVRATVVLPSGTGKTVRVAALVDDNIIETAKKAGADIAGNDSLLADIAKGQIDFDVLVAAPSLMPKLGQHAKVLGPRGLMPNPKSGTVTTDVAKAVAEAKAGRVEYRVDGAGIIHLGIGKVSFGVDKLEANAQAIMLSLRAAKPASLKGPFIRSIYVTTTMGPSIKVEA